MHCPRRKLGRDAGNFFVTEEIDSYPHRVPKIWREVSFAMEGMGDESIPPSPAMDQKGARPTHFAAELAPPCPLRFRYGQRNFGAATNREDATTFMEKSPSSAPKLILGIAGLNLIATSKDVTFQSCAAQPQRDRPRPRGQGSPESSHDCFPAGPKAPRPAKQRQSLARFRTSPGLSPNA